MATLQTEERLRGTRSAIWKTRSAGVEKVARLVVSVSITVNVVASMGTFNTAILPAGLTYLQQAVALLMWSVLIYASAFVRPRLQLAFNPDLIALLAFYALAVVSVLWTTLNAAAIMKSAALAMTTFGAFCLITRIDIDDVVKATSSGLFILVAASALCAIAVPDIGIDHSWMHNGQWQGVYNRSRRWALSARI